jgi:hypothetical protein
MLDTITAKFDVTGQADGVDGRASAQCAIRPIKKFCLDDELVALL